MERILLRKELPNKIPQNMFDTFTYQVYMYKPVKIC